MRIGIDYTAAVWQKAGIGRYTRELIGATIAQGGAFTYVLFFASGGLDYTSPYVNDVRALCRTYPNVRAVPIPLSPRRLTQLWQRLKLPLPVEFFTGKLDLLHAPDFVLPPTRARTLLTIHDLSFLVYPQFAVPSMARYLSEAVPRALHRADHVLADSQATRDDLARLLGVAAQRVTVIYPGVSSAFRPLPPEQCELVRRKLDLPDEFLLFVSTFSPRKNIVRLVHAFDRIIAGNARPNLVLVLAGQRGWLDDEIFAEIERLQLQQRVRILNFVDDNDLPAVYNLARVSVYPSLYEGFGLPALEALACGTPLVTADNSSLLEVAGDAALTVGAEDVSALVAAIARALDDAALRTHLHTAGPQQAQQFTWEHAAQQLLACYTASNTHG